MRTDIRCSGGFGEAENREENISLMFLAAIELHLRENSSIFVPALHAKVFFSAHCNAIVVKIANFLPNWEFFSDHGLERFSLFRPIFGGVRKIGHKFVIHFVSIETPSTSKISSTS
jgi:hypothetical protein